MISPYEAAVVSLMRNISDLIVMTKEGARHRVDADSLAEDSLSTHSVTAQRDGATGSVTALLWR